MRRPPAAALILAMPIALLMLAACGGGSDGDDDPTPTSSPPSTAEPTASEPSDAIRSIDLESAPAVSTFIDETSGTYVQENVLYGDVTGDGIEDAVIPVSSGGTLGDIAFMVVTIEGEDNVAEALAVEAREFGVSVRIEGGKLVSVEPVPGPDDPECCPSQIRTTTYAGDGGSGLTEESSVVEDNPAGGVKSPSPFED